MDAVHIKEGRYKYLIVARDDLSGWVEAAPLINLTAKNVAEFFLNNWVYRYGVMKLVTVDGGPEFGTEFKEAVLKVGSKVRVATPYYPEAEGMVERGHQVIKDALVKMCGTSAEKWRHYLPLVLFADRITAKRTTGFSPYELVFGQKAVLPVDLEAESYLGVDWDTVKTTEELLCARMMQLEKKEEYLEKAYSRMMKIRNQSVRYWDERLAHRLRKPLNPGDMVLVYNRSLESQWGKMFADRWNGPYKIKEQVSGGSYVLEELDGVVLKKRVAADQVKRFYPRGTRSAEVFLRNEDKL
ncbi:transposase family protein [Xanthomonas sp. A2111]|uniref:Transposase family protein n=1 Tax=Xanthomonas hawaiiensis TaxID=3003247 RepID=A0ABU2IAM4_9XANT|nr:transposase family protein [Xanthomonas sp. A2111]MDS9995181.1 transposase family protein [Xanthomonas sp. A2111]